MSILQIRLKLQNVFVLRTSAVHAYLFGVFLRQKYTKAPYYNNKYCKQYSLIVNDVAIRVIDFGKTLFLACNHVKGGHVGGVLVFT